MDITKENIKAWLKRRGSDREWLGQQLGVSKKTVHNWLSSEQPIPDSKLALIRRLMADDEAVEALRSRLSQPANTVFTVEVSHQQYRVYAECARDQHQTVEEWAIESLDAAAEAWHLEQQQQPAQEEEAQAAPTPQTTPNAQDQTREHKTL